MFVLQLSTAALVLFLYFVICIVYFVLLIRKCLRAFCLKIVIVPVGFYSLLGAKKLFLVLFSFCKVVMLRNISTLYRDCCVCNVYIDRGNNTER